MSEQEEPAPAQARASSAVLITDTSAEGEAIGGALRSRGFEVDCVPLGHLEARIVVEAPRVVILDADEQGAIEVVQRIHELPGGAAATVLLIGDAVRSAELDPHLFAQIFERPVDLAELVANVAAVAEPARSRRTRGTTPPPSFVAHPATGRPAPMESEIPGNSDFPGDLDPIDVGSMVPGYGGEEGVAPRIGPARISPELEQLLAAAEQRVTGGGRPSSIPSAEDEVDLILSPELLSALDDSLDPDEDGPGTGSGMGTPMQKSARFTTGAGGTGADHPAPAERTPEGRGEGGAKSGGGRSTDPGVAESAEAPPWSLAHSGAGVWAQGSPFRKPSGGGSAGGLTPVELQREPIELRLDEPAAASDEERWAAGTRDEDEARREPAPAPAEAEPRWSAEPVQELGETEPVREVDLPGDRSFAALGGGHGHGRAPLVSAPRDVRVRSVSEMPLVSGPLHVDADVLMGGAAVTPRVRADPEEPQAARQATISDIPWDDGASARHAAPRPPPPPPLPAPAMHAARPPPYMEDPAPSSRAPAITVLGPGDAPRALARAVGSRVSGSLAVTAEGGSRRIVLHEGDLVTAASDLADETLLSFLAARGDIPRDVLTRLAGKLPASGRHAGAALIAHGHLGQDDLWPVLRAHAEWIIGQVTLIDAGTCELEDEPPGRLKAEPNVFGGATGAEVFVETIRRVLAPEVAMRRLGGHAARLDDGVRQPLLGECALRREEEDLVRSARGRAVGEIINATEPEMATLLYALVCLEVLDVLIPPSASEAPRAAPPDPLDDEAIRQRVRARLALVQDGDYFAVLGIPRDATNYEIRRAYLTLRRAFEPSRLLTAATVDLLDDVRVVVEVLDEAYEILREPHRRERYRRAIEAAPP